MEIKQLVKPFIIIVSALLLFWSCYADRMNRHHHILFKNNSNHVLFVFGLSKEEHLALPHFHDTILQPYDPHPRLDSAVTKIKPDAESMGVLFNRSAYESSFGYEFDTLLVFVINADTLETYGWDSVRTSYKVEQRYDLRLDELKAINFKLSFPPTEDMKHIHMWPPYGTYDEHGQKKKQ